MSIPLWRAIARKSVGRGDSTITAVTRPSRTSIGSAPRATSASASAPGRAACRTRTTTSDRRRCAFTEIPPRERGGSPSFLRATRVLHPRSTSVTSILHPAGGGGAGDDPAGSVEDLPEDSVVLDE